MGWHPNSTGHISEFLCTMAQACLLEVPHHGPAVVLLLDEIFTNGQPIFVVMEASSHYILYIALMTDRKGKTWETVLKHLQDNGLDIGLLVKDQGSGPKAAALTLGLLERTDLFHLLKPFDPFLPSMERHGYGAIEKEFESLRVFANRKSEESLAKSLVKYEMASAEADRAMRHSDNYDYLHKCLHESFDSFTAEGCLRTRTTAESDIEAALSLLEEEFPAHTGILAAVKFLRKNLPDYWGYFEQLENIILHQPKTIPEHTIRAVCLAWQLARKSMAVKSSHWKKELSRQAKAQLALARTGADEKMKVAIESLFKALDSNVRSSSPLEAINSIIREYLNACRGQTTQEALTMLAFFLNHRKATRGKYAGTSPNERLTGLPENATPIEQIMKLAQRTSGRKPQSTAKPSSEAALPKAA